MNPRRLHHQRQTSNFWACIPSSAYNPHYANNDNFHFGGPEQIIDANDASFETNAGHWIGHGNHSIVGRTTSDKWTGTASLQLSVSGPGDSTSNYFELPAANFNALTYGLYAAVRSFLRATASGTIATFILGDQTWSTVSGGVLSTTAGSFSVCPNIFQASANNMNGQSLKLYFNQADTIYLDGNSIRQAYAGILLFAFRGLRTLEAATTIILSCGSAAGGGDNLGWELAMQAASTSLVGNGAFSIATGARSALGEQICLFVSIIDRVNGVITNYSFIDAPGNGPVKVQSATPFRQYVDLGGTSPQGFFIGSRNTSFGKYPGWYGPCQLTMFKNGVFPFASADQDTFIHRIAMNWQRTGFPKVYDGGTTIFDYRWENGGNDISANAFNLTMTGSPRINRLPFI